MEGRVAEMSSFATSGGKPSDWKRWLRCEIQQGGAGDTLDEPSLDLLGLSTGLDSLGAGLAELLIV